MRKWILSAFLLVLAGAVKAETNAYDYESITVTTSAVKGLTAAVLSPSGGARPKSVFITIETDSIRFRVDGSDPTATEGHQVSEDVTGLTLTGEENLRHFRAIGSGSASATLRVTYER